MWVMSLRCRQIAEESEKGKIFEYDGGPVCIKEGKLQGAYGPERISLGGRYQGKSLCG